MEAGNGTVRAVKVTGAALIGGIATASLLSLDLPPWLREMTAQYGPGFLMIAVVFAAVAYYVPRDVIPNFVDAQQKQATALTGIEHQMGRLADDSSKLDEIKDILSEVLINQRVNGDRLKVIEARTYGRTAEDE